MKTLTSLFAAIVLFCGIFPVMAESHPTTTPADISRLLQAISWPATSPADRAAEVEILKSCDSMDVLPPLLNLMEAPALSKYGWGEGCILLPLDPKDADSDLLTFEAVNEVWMAHSSADTVSKVLASRLDSESKARMISDLSIEGFGGEPLEKVVANCLRDQKEESALRYAAAKSLARLGEKYEPEIVAMAAGSSFEMKKLLVDVAILALEKREVFAYRFRGHSLSPPHQIDPTLARIAYNLIDEEIEQPHAGPELDNSPFSAPRTAISEAVPRFSTVVGVDFYPEDSGNTGASNWGQFDKQALQNARQWWVAHKDSLAATQPAAFDRKN